MHSREKSKQILIETVGKIMIEVITSFECAVVLEFEKKPKSPEDNSI